ncbi:excinuclease ABC subunit C [Candidatus Woesearchaeota archaeon]|jgi:excinuclease ABC subunit C|nr:excinuclease ABC subunit C [Candidatus Woesearchaeota archaeon]
MAAKNPVIDINTLPTLPGCYLFKNKKGIVIYVGKAKNIKKRVNSYFKKNHESKKTEQLVLNIKTLEIFVTNTEVEALLLENNLIKKYMPKYNIDLKDSKRYAYITIPDEKYPRLLIARKKLSKGKYFGPFISGQTRDHILEFLKRTYRLRTCRRFPKKECLRYHINLCDAPCTGKITEQKYLEYIKNIELILKGNISELTSILKIEMKTASEKLNFEKAQDIKNRLQALAWLKEKQTMQRDKNIDEDVINYLIKEDIVYLIIFNISKGIVINKQKFEFDYDSEFLEEFIRRYYEDNKIPKEIIVPKKISESTQKYLEKVRKTKIKITVPEKGEKKTLLKIIIKNIESKQFAGETNLLELKKALRMPEPPKIIECFDISHLSGTSTVASMVQFKDGTPNKSEYRKFKIRTVSGIDDFSSIAEVIKRRYTRLLKEKKSFPNLIVVDGGKGQLSFALKELAAINVKIPIIALAKRDEEIFFPGRTIPLKLDKKNKGLQLLQQIRDEAHRFAITYNRLLRKKKLTK